MKILYSLIFSLCFVFSIFPQNNISYKEKIDSLLTNPFFESCNISIDVFDLTTEENLYKKNEKLLMRPASNLKLFTSAAGLYFLGEEYTFKTSVYYKGEVEDSVLFGDIYIVGGFDPEFTSKDLDSMVTQIKLQGIKEIHGNLYADASMMDSLYWGQGWMWDDDPYIYSPYLSPLCINNNGIEIYYEPGEVGAPVKVEIYPESNFYHLHNSSVTVETDSSNLTITRDYVNHTNDISITGTLSSQGKRDTAELNIVYPEKYFLTLMKENFKRSGITLTGTTDTASLPNQADHIITFERSYIDVLPNLNKESDNLNAESV
ncbi:MAG: D-alanyl-D-alanine carboxypeptidase/D-alanyl-D-alanine-endopeptidase, partial [Ignavibacteria bacterium RBG_13_36_8]